MPVVVDGAATTVLLPLVDGEAAATVLSALRAEFGSLRVFRQQVTADRLRSFGSLSGRLRAASAPDGTV